MKPAFFSSLKGYRLQNLATDIMSGILVAIIALPLSIALGIQSGATLQQGIVTAIVAGFFISFLGGSRVQIGGPTAAFVAIIVGYIGSIGLLGLHLATIMAGIIMIFMGLFKIGGLVKYIPYPIVIGFTSGIGVTLLVGQLKDFTGISSANNLDIFSGVPEIFHSEFIVKITNLGSNFLSISLPTLAIGILTIIIMIILPKINKKIPAAFMAIIITTCITCILGVFSSTNYGIATIGSIYPDVKAEFILPKWSEIGNINFASLIMPSIVIAFLGSVESLLSATVADNLIGEKHNSNMELVGQGIANIASATLGGLPATGAIARTAANIQNGGRTPIAGMTHSIMLLIMFFALMPVLKFVPMASLSAVLIMVSINMANFKLFAKLATFNKTDLAILITTFVFTVYKDLVYGVLIGMAITLVLMAKDVFKKPHVNVLEDMCEEYLEYASEGKSKIIIPDTNLNFINYNQIIKYCDNNLDEYANIIIDLKNIKKCDVSSTEKLVKMQKQLQKLGKKFDIINANPYILTQFDKMRKL